MIRKLMALAGLVVALEACAGPPPPTYSADAFKGIFNQNSASVPANAPATMTPPVGIIFSENVETYLGYIKNAGEYWDSVVPTSLKNHVVYADADPTYFAGQVLAMLKARFPSATVIHDFNAAVSSSKKSVVLIDLHTKTMKPYGDRTTQDRRRRLFLQRAHGSGVAPERPWRIQGAVRVGRCGCPEIDRRGAAGARRQDRRAGALTGGRFAQQDFDRSINAMPSSGRLRRRSGPAFRRSSLPGSAARCP